MHLLFIDLLMLTHTCARDLHFVVAIYNTVIFLHITFFKKFYRVHTLNFDQIHCSNALNVWRLFTNQQTIVFIGAYYSFLINV